MRACAGYTAAVETNFAIIALVLHFYAVLLANKSRATFSTNQE